MKTQLQETYKDRWQEYFERALEEQGFPPDYVVSNTDDALFDTLSKRADELLAESGGE